MELNVITGRAGTGKTYGILRELAEKSAAEPLGFPLLLLVPEQATFNAEWSLLNDFNIRGSLRVQICGFKKLFEILAKEQRITLKPWLDNLGKSMILRKIVNNHRSDFTVFGKSAKHSGFVDNLMLMMDELTTFQISKEQLEQAEKQIFAIGENPMVGEKLADISLIYGEYADKLQQDYCDETRLLEILAEAVTKSEILQKAEIYLDGFTDFDPAQAEVVKALIKKCAKVTVALVMDSKEFYEEDNVFAFSEKTYNQLKSFAEAENIPFCRRHLAENKRLAGKEDLLALESAFAVKSSLPQENLVPENVQIVRAAKNSDELNFVALEILNLVKKQGCRMSDFAVISRSLADCRRLIEDTFNSYNIPYFTDNAQSMFHHPLVETVLAMVEIEAENWQSSAVLRYLKAGMADISLDNLDVLENYALANGIKGTYWQKAGSWQRYYQNNVNKAVSKDEEEAAEACRKLAEINETGEKAIKPLLSFHYALRDLQKKDGKYLLADVIAVLQKSLENMALNEILEQWEAKAETRGLLQQAAFHRQILAELFGLFGQLKSFLGDTYVTLGEVYTLLEEGAGKMELNSIPASADEVMICDISRTRMPSIKYAFVIDCNEGIFPAKVADDGLLNSAEREDLRKIGLNLAVSKRQLQFTEDYHIYTALTRACCKLYLCYAEFDAALNPLQPSVILENTSSVLPNIKVTNGENLLRTTDIFSNFAFFNEMEKQISLAKNGEAVDNVWWQILKYYKEEKYYPEQINAMQSGLAYQKDNSVLPPEAVNALYGNFTTTSVSRVEAYNRCPCMYYGRYGLKLEPRQEFKVRTQDVGQIYHSILAYVLDKLLADNTDFRQLKVTTVKALVQEAIEKYMADGMGGILTDSNKNSYLKYKITTVVTKSIMDISTQMAAGDFRPLGFEVKFGRNAEIDGLSIKMPNGKKIVVHGFIDRIDMAESEKGEYYRIIDYKSSDKNLDLNDIYYGLNWQMPIYLEAVLNSKRQDKSKKIKPAGMFYFPIRETVTSVDTMTAQGADEQKLQGLILLDDEAIRLAENDFFQTGTAKTMNLRLLKSGSYGKNDKAIDGLQYDVILRYIKKHLSENIEKIINGDISQCPICNNNILSCDYCDFQKICILDNNIRMNYYKIKKQKPDEVIRIMQSDIGMDDE